MSETTLDIGDTWEFSFPVPEDSVVTVTLTDPNGDTTPMTPVIEDEEATISATLTEGGRYLAVVIITTDGVTAVTPYTVWAEEPGGHVPTFEEVKAYLNAGGEISWTDDQVQDALNTERSDQFKVCTIPANYPAALAGALKRRVARNIAAQSMPIAQITTFDTGQTVNRVPRTDPEVIRLEGPYRRIALG